MKVCSHGRVFIRPQGANSPSNPNRYPLKCSCFPCFKTPGYKCNYKKNLTFELDVFSWVDHKEVFEMRKSFFRNVLEIKQLLFKETRLNYFKPAARHPEWSIQSCGAGMIYDPCCYCSWNWIFIDNFFCRFICHMSLVLNGMGYLPIFLLNFPGLSEIFTLKADVSTASP